MLYGAIYSNTLCLKGALTTERDLAASNWLLFLHPQANTYLVAQLQARSAKLLAGMPGSLKAEMKIMKSRFGTFGFSQFEMPGAEAFWQERQNEIRAYFAGLDHPVVFNLIDLDTVTSRIYCNDDAYRVTLDHHCMRNEETHSANPARMRKEISLLFM